MALFVFSSTTTYPSIAFLSSSLSSSHVSAYPFYRLRKNFTGLHPKSVCRLQIKTSSIIKERSALIVKASSEADGTGPDGVEPPPSEGEKTDIPVEDLPLESKQQLLLEQRLRMKLAKKIRLRRKRLVMKRRLRKKGRWPPSKMKKNKNV
ncbi:large ribosomal subunit protein cL37 [Rhododendron vialii]|uniref:large ribosomal subunit protein cL37 n=1 Tax=Rhododendron vialii TaxID=182163 RepID=UPI00265ED719|nr:large ribosomal subunit protein cL37 [Rhododendron vialii]